MSSVHNINPFFHLIHLTDDDDDDDVVVKNLYRPTSCFLSVAHLHTQKAAHALLKLISQKTEVDDSLLHNQSLLLITERHAPLRIPLKCASGCRSPL